MNEWDTLDVAVSFVFDQHWAQIFAGSGGSFELTKGERDKNESDGISVRSMMISVLAVGLLIVQRRVQVPTSFGCESDTRCKWKCGYLQLNWWNPRGRTINERHHLWLGAGSCPPQKCVHFKSCFYLNVISSSFLLLSDTGATSCSWIFHPWDPVANFSYLTQYEAQLCVPSACSLLL